MSKKINKIGFGGVSFQGLLDLFPNAAVGYSLRKLRASYTGACIRVRRSNDNAESDIGFDNNILDTAALLSFVGANDGFVTTWYDQSGNAKNLIQTTGSNQPRIVNAGVFDTAIRFDGTNDVLFNGNLNLNTGIINGATDVLSSVVFSTTNTTSNQFIHSCPSGDSVNRGFDVRIPNSTQLQLAIRTNPSNTSTNAIATFNYSTGNKILVTGTFNASLTSNEQKLYINSNLAQQVSNSGSSIQNNGLNRALVLGRISNATFADNVHFNGFINELVIYNTDQTTNRVGIETNINNYYAIYP